MPLKGDTLAKLGHTARRPVDKNAAADVFQRSVEPWEALNVGSFAHSCTAPLPFVPAHFLRAAERGELAKRIGVTFGRMTVIGLTAHGGRKAHEKGLLYVCRCACGCYETRRSRAITNPRNTWDCCYECRRLEKIKRTEQWLLTGKNVCANCGEPRPDQGQCPNEACTSRIGRA